LTSPRPPLLGRSAGLTGTATLASRILGLLRDQVLAGVFGAGNEMDAFVVAFRIPNLVRDLFAEGAMSAAFVPTFTERLTLDGKDDAWRLGNNLLTSLLITTAALVAVGMVFTRPLVSAYAGDFARIPGKMDLTIRLTRMLLPFLPMVAIAAAAMGMLNSLHYFFVPALAPALFNIATIVCAFVLVPFMPSLGLPPIAAIAIGALLGGILQVLVQWPPLKREGFRYRFLLDVREPGLRRVLMLMGPGTIGLAATQVNLFVNTLLATTQGTGAVSWLSFAFRLMYLPIGLFGVSIATAALPAVSRSAAVGDEAGIRRTTAQAMAMMMVLNVPATLGLVTLADPIIRLLFERGRFTASDTASTAAALRLYAVGLLGYATARIISPVFYAMKRSRVPVMVSLCTVAINLAANVTLVRVMGFRGLALGTSLAMLVNGVALLLLLRRRLHGVEEVYLGVTFVKITLAAVLMAAVVLTVEQFTGRVIAGSGSVAQALRLGLAIGAGLSMLVAAARLLRIREFDRAFGRVSARLM
jgi:putative peptidoglycan lipid II flippase